MASVFRVLVTRSPHQASDLADHLRALGAQPILIPTIETVDPTTFTPLDSALADLQTFHWLLFTSANAVEAFYRRYVVFLGSGDNHGLKSPRPGNNLELGSHGPAQSGALAPEVCPLPPGLKVAAIGPATARALAVAPNLIPPQAVAESLTEALVPHALQPDGTPTRFLLIRAEEAREHLPDTLRAAGAEVTVAPAYRTVTPAGSIQAIRELFGHPASYPDAITFTSSSTARNLFTLLEAASLALPETVVRASIGPITSATLRELGYPPHTEAAEATVAALAENVVKYLHLRKMQ